MVKFFSDSVRESGHPPELRIHGAMRLLFLFFAVSLFSAGCDSSTTGSGTVGRSATTAGTVQLEADFAGRQANVSVAVPCSLDSTVFQILERAQNMGDLKFEFSGDKENPAELFINSINGIENEGGGGDNWVYRVNDQLGNSGSGVFEVKKGDHIIWKLGKYPE